MGLKTLRGGERQLLVLGCSWIGSCTVPGKTRLMMYERAHKQHVPADRLMLANDVHPGQAPGRQRSMTVAKTSRAFLVSLNVEDNLVPTSLLCMQASSSCE